MKRKQTMSQDFRERAKLFRAELKKELGYGPHDVAVRSNRHFMRVFRGIGVHGPVDVDVDAVRRLGKKYEMGYLDLTSPGIPFLDAVEYIGLDPTD